MRNRGFASACKGAYLAYVTAARVKQSPIYRYKPNPPLKHIVRYVDDSVRIPPLIIIPRHNLAHIP